MGWLGPRADVEQLVRDHYAALYRFAYRLAGGASDAEDLVQETFCQAHAKIRQLREAGKARGWLYAILRNAYLKKLRDEEKTRSLDEAQDVCDRGPEPLPEIDPGRLQQALQELPEGFRTPLLLFYFEEFSYREIAEQMNVPLGTVMSRLARARSALRQKLAPESAAVPTSRGESH